MRMSKSRLVAASLFAVCALLGRIAPAAYAQDADPDAAAMAELEELLQVKSEPKTQAEAVKLLLEMADKAAAFAEKHPNDNAGAIALLLVAQVSLQRLGDDDRAAAAMKKFLDRYPKHPEAAVAKFFLASALMGKFDHTAAKEVLDALIKDHPDFRGKSQAEAMLKKIALFVRPAPDFTTKDLAGNDVKLSDFKGRKIVLLDFYAGWCGPCRTEMPNLVKLYAKYKDRGFEIVGISLDGSAAKAKDYAKSAGITWTATWQAPGGWKTPIAGLYDVRGIPATFLIGKDGKIMQAGLRGAALARTLADIFPEKKPGVKDAPKPTAE
ncbi:MAG: redoxin domain-containing protein [Planctomycetota bacterium]